jgi:hypothetical protein
MIGLFNVNKEIYMKKIVGIINMFDTYQNFYIYEDGTKLENLQIKTVDIPEKILELSYAN